MLIIQIVGGLFLFLVLFGLLRQWFDGNTGARAAAIWFIIIVCALGLFLI